MHRTDSHTLDLANSAQPLLGRSGRAIGRIGAPLAPRSLRLAPMKAN